MLDGRLVGLDLWTLFPMYSISTVTSVNEVAHQVMKNPV
jgi:hypothetical protein